MGYIEDTRTERWVHKRVWQAEGDGHDHDDEDMPLVASIEPLSSAIPSSFTSNMGIDARFDAMMETTNENAQLLDFLEDTIKNIFATTDHAMTSWFNDIDQQIRCILEH